MKPIQAFTFAETAQPKQPSRACSGNPIGPLYACVVLSRGIFQRVAPCRCMLMSMSGATGITVTHATLFLLTTDREVTQTSSRIGGRCLCWTLPCARLGFWLKSYFLLYSYTPV